MWPPTERDSELGHHHDYRNPDLRVIPTRPLAVDLPQLCRSATRHTLRRRASGWRWTWLRSPTALRRRRAPGERLGDGCACQYNIWHRRIYVCVYIYMYIFICTYIHTHTHTHTHIYIYTYVCIDTWYVYYCAFYNMCTHKSICIHIMYKDAYVQKYASMLPMDVAGYVSLSLYIYNTQLN